MWRERRKLVETWQQGRAAALATLVAVEGSSYRKPGARLMVTTNGDYVGSISGGCLEADVVRKMRWLVRQGACIERYSTAFDDTADLPYGSGCGGTVEILMEPADTPEFHVLMESLAASLRGETSRIRTMLPAPGRALARTVLAENAPPSNALQNAKVYDELLQPPQRLLVFGAGDDAQPLVSMAALLGWRVFVIDGRMQWARPERFPDADAVLSHPPGTPLPFAPEHDDLAVVMTHSFEQDRLWLHTLLPQGLRYLGLLGARHRSALLAGQLAEELNWSLDEVCDRLRAPVGLDLGGDGAETVALAILAEMQARIADRPILSRRMTPHAVAEQIASLAPQQRSNLQSLQCSL